jgi:glutathione S-transferase
MRHDGVILYHNNSSVCAAKVRVAMAEKSLTFESKLLLLDGDQFDPAYLALNPAAVVPTLVHQGQAITESNVILEYLEDAFPETPLRPVDPYSRAQARILMQRLDDGASGIHHAASVVTFAIAYRHHLIEQAGGNDHANLAATISSNMNPKSRAWLEDVVFKGIDAPSFRKALMRFDELLADFEARLTGTGWLAGDGYSIADVAFTPYMIRLDLLQMSFLWRNRPAVTKWYTQLSARNSAAAVLDWIDPKNIDTLTSRGRDAAPEMAAMLSEGVET